MQEIYDRALVKALIDPKCFNNNLAVKATILASDEDIFVNLLMSNGCKNIGSEPIKSGWFQPKFRKVLWEIPVNKLQSNIKLRETISLACKILQI